jgi:hypothetical protein
MVSAIGGGEASPPKNPSDFNPYEVGTVTTSKDRGTITKENFGVLRSIVDAYVSQR